jgi:hypothetical protein
MKKLLIILILLFSASPVFAVVTHKTRTINTFITNGVGTAVQYYAPSTSYSWNAGMWWISNEAIISLAYGRPLAVFNTSAVESANVKVKSVKVTGTFDTSEGSDTATYKQLTNNTYTTLTSAQTVFTAIGSAASYASQSVSGTLTDLGSNAVTQMEKFLADGKFSLGIKGTEPASDKYMPITALPMELKYYYPPSEADTWEINESYPMGTTTGKGIGTAVFNGPISITSTGKMQLNGNTSLVASSSITKRLTISKNGSTTLETLSSLKI